MGAQLVGSVGAAHSGCMLHVVSDGRQVLITDKRTRMTVSEGRELCDALVNAVNDDGTARVAVIGTIGRVSVLRWSFAVTLTDHPNPLTHSGWTMRVDQARELIEVLRKAIGDETGGQ